MANITAEILTVGTEILLGNIVNSNAAFLSQGLAGLGIAIFRHTSVGDNHVRLTHALECAFANADIVITTGGLGPTQDDITKGVAAEFFGLELETHEDSWQRIKKRFSGRDLPENVLRNALVPQGASVFPNEYGSAPGICIELHGKILIMFPGPPHEMQPMFSNYAADFLREKTDCVFASQTLKIIGMGETAVESQLRDLIDAQTNPTIAPYAKVGEVHIRVTAAAVDEIAALALITPIAEEIRYRLSPRIYGENEETLAEVVLNLLRENGHTLAVAESCTGGMIAADLVAVPGCSAVFREGFVTYSNEAKNARLSVPKDLLNVHGAVSAEVAAAMAEGVAKAADASVGLSTTGIAGPDGGSTKKPVGLVYIGLYVAGRGTQTIETLDHEKNNRNGIRRRSTILALDFLRRSL